jgi:hypothetical protein
MEKPQRCTGEFNIEDLHDMCGILGEGRFAWISTLLPCGERTLPSLE